MSISLAPQQQQQQQPPPPSGPPPPQQHYSSEVSRGSNPPPGPHLPPIHHFDARSSSMNSQYQQHFPQSNGAPMPPPPPPPYPPQHSYPSYPPNGRVPPAPMPSNATNQRYPIPPPPALDAHNMPGARHKKEIKRRTKTGCLTCRKRRIKCDEAQPSCRNCAKSKRECLGYDPIWKPMTGPANIQPAPAGNNPPPPPTANINPSAPQSFQHSFPGTGGTFIPASAPAAPAAHPDGTQPYGEYGVSLDPALSSGDQPLHMAQNNYPPALQPQRRVNPIQIEDLFSLNDVPPQYRLREAPPPVSPERQHEIGSFFKYHYAAGLDRLFETTWYQHRGLDHLQREPMLQDFVAQCTEQMKAKSGDDTGARMSLEARLVWLLAAMPRSAASTANGTGNDPLTQELLPRIDTVEHLLTGQSLDPSRVPPPPQQPPPGEPHQDSSTANQKYNEQSFWHHLGRFTSLRDDNPAVLKDINDALQNVRVILSMLENRDVLYSIAIARHIGGRTLDFHPQRHLVASSNDPNDDVNKLKVAHQFVEGEDQRGTTQVIQRICSMALRSWVLQKS
ncbi:White-opaque regulator 1 [Lecanosticta acicola]|uniref:White-opaque regulator 1 n=1 Tax=Lecanosticta acicola TaxID=111012 RepID=A0AAI9E8Q8_9PEZI|nr:White-opaque regulator 1 [Lecanosticta acicola]